MADKLQTYVQLAQDTAWQLTSSYESFFKRLRGCTSIRIPTSF